MIQFNNVSKKYDKGHKALSHIQFHLEQGEMAFLTGHSGAGKSTLLKLIMLIEKPTQGQVLVAGQNLSRMPRRKIPYLRRSIGMVFQEPRLLPERSVFENVSLPLIVAGVPRGDIAKRVRAALDVVGLLSKEKNFPLALSGGEQHRVGIARAIVSRPPLLLADEPTGNLDPELSREIMRVFEQLNQVGITVMIATHDLPMIASLPYRILTLKKGKLC